MLFVGIPGQALPLATTGQIRENGFATNSSYGTGWECSHSFKESNGSCKLVLVPGNAYLNESTHGPGWECERGYRADGDECVAVTVPENAHLHFSGNDWECDGPYSKRSDRCVASRSK